MPVYVVVAHATVRGAVIRFGPLSFPTLPEVSPGELVDSMDREITRRYGASAKDRKFAVSEIVF